MSKIGIVSSLMLALASAAENLVWSSVCSPGYDKCATLHFCGSGGSYGYRLPGASGCSAGGPTIRLDPGNKYELTLQNDSPVPTNLHTHGLHISGAGNADDVTRYVDPSMCMKYTWDIKADSMGGTYWYHSHKHGMTQEQVSGGAVGLIIVNDNANLLDAVDSASRDGITAWLANTLEFFVSPHAPTASISRTFGDGEWFRARIAYADSAGKTGSFAVTGACEARTVANDGVWINNVPGLTSNDFEMSGSSRRDLAVRCTGSGTISGPEGTMVQLSVSGNSGLSSPFTSTGGTWSPTRPAHLVSVLAANVPTANTFSVKMTASQIAGKSWDPDVPLRTIAYDEVHEWTISGSGSHPFHLHLYHFQIASSGGCGEGYPEGEWFDTLATKSSCLIRFRAMDVGERCVLHCHVLSHEDNGSMGWVDVQGAGMVPQSSVNREQATCAGGGVPPTPPPTPSPTADPTNAEAPPTPPPTPPPTDAPTDPTVNCLPASLCDGNSAVGESCCEGGICTKDGKGKRAVFKCA